jgi:hypothetical protein
MSNRVLTGFPGEFSNLLQSPNPPLRGGARASGSSSRGSYASLSDDEGYTQGERTGERGEGIGEKVGEREGERVGETGDKNTDDAVSLGVKKLSTTFVCCVSFWLLSYIMVMLQVIDKGHFVSFTAFLFIPMWIGETLTPT